MLFLVLKHLSFYEIVLECMDLLNGLTWQNKELVIHTLCEITASKFKKCQSVKDQEQKLMTGS